MNTIHVILNAHIDPVWLWPWQSGLDEVLATCRSACNRLDAHPDITFTRGEAWVYEQIERVDPALFDRIRNHIQSGQWEIIGGWYIQPDCNLPSFWAMEKQIALGKAYFLDRFGIFPHIAYNVDSFGQAAALPGLMRSAGQDCYVTTRPSQEELPMTSRIFRWRGYEDGPEVTVCRPTFANSADGISTEFLSSTLELLPDGCEHAICFVGVGDHGGGPTEQQIAWIRRHQDDVEGWRVEFSSLNRYFEAIHSLQERLPLFVGELQHHAIGCYSVSRSVKTLLRRTEHLLLQAETLDSWDSPTREALDQAWKRVCFHHFHDTLAGACTPTAYVTVIDQLGGAAAAANEALHYDLRRRINDLPDDKLQKIVIRNASPLVFDDFVEYEPWVGPWTNRWRDDRLLIDEMGNPVEFQLMDAEALAFGTRGETVLPRLLFRIRVQPGELRVLRIKRSETVPRAAHFPGQSGHVSASTADGISNDQGIKCGLNGVTWLLNGAAFSLPLRLDLIADSSDTWSHGLDRFEEEAVATARWENPVVVDDGPLMASMVQEGQIGQSSLHAEWRLYAQQEFVDVTYKIYWREHFRILKLVLPFASQPKRVDGVMGSSLVRDNDGRERPLRDWTLATSNDGQQLGIVCPDVFGIDATRDRLRLTLLRSPLMAHHAPAPWHSNRGEYADQATHVFRFRLYYGDIVSAEMLNQDALTLQRPLIIADSTRGMPAILPGSEGLLQD